MYEFKIKYDTSKIEKFNQTVGRVYSAEKNTSVVFSLLLIELCRSLRHQALKVRKRESSQEGYLCHHHFHKEWTKCIFQVSKLLGNKCAEQHAYINFQGVDLLENRIKCNQRRSLGKSSCWQSLGNVSLNVFRGQNFNGPTGTLPV